MTVRNPDNALMLRVMTAKQGNMIPSRREFAISLGIMAMLMRVLIAPGFMPDPDAAAHGDFKLVICSAGGLTTIPAFVDGDTSENGHDGRTDLCPFAALNHLAMLADEPQPVNAPISHAIEDTVNRGAITASAARIPEARAPPLLT